MERRLAAVLVADVVGYSRLSGIDEEGTRARFRGDLRDVFEPRFARHRGRLVKTMGDGLLVEFQSVVDAVHCAIDIQRAKSKEAASDSRRLTYRIGINLGDVILEGDDIHGDGVNVAARLEALAEPGGVAISGAAYDQVRNKIAAGYASLGEQRVKNIAEPVRVYRVLTSPDDIGKTISIRQGWLISRRSWIAIAVTLAIVGAAVTAWLRPWARAPAQSIVVLPFENLSQDAEQGYFADGVTEDLTTALARVPGLFVLSRNAAFRYKDKLADPKRLASEMNVHYVLEGSVQRAGDELRINARLIDGDSGSNIWADRFDGTSTDVFSLQDQVVAEVADTLQLHLAPTERRAPGGTRSPAAYDAYLRGIDLYRRYWRSSPKDLARAIPFFKQAIAMDPDYGQAYAGLAQVYWDAYGWERFLGLTPEEDLDRVNEYLAQAMKHPSAAAYRLAAWIPSSPRIFADALTNLQQAIPLDPSSADTYIEMAYWLVLAGRLADGRRYLDAALQVDPSSTSSAGYVEGLIQFDIGQYEQAAGTLEKYLAAYPNDAYTRVLLVAAYGQLGRVSDAARTYQKANEYFSRGSAMPPWTILQAGIAFPLADHAYAERLRQGLVKAGVPELPFDYDPASKDRLNASEIGSLLFGHTIIYKNRDAVSAASIAFTKEGTPTRISVGSSEAGILIEDYAAVLEDRGLCFWWRRGGPECAAVFRNRKGSREQKNEFLWITAGGHWEFSVVD